MWSGLAICQVAGLGDKRSFGQTFVSPPRARERRLSLLPSSSLALLHLFLSASPLLIFFSPPPLLSLLFPSRSLIPFPSPLSFSSSHPFFLSLLRSSTLSSSPLSLDPSPLSSSPLSFDSSPLPLPSYALPSPLSLDFSALSSFSLSLGPSLLSFLPSWTLLLNHLSYGKRANRRHDNRRESSPAFVMLRYCL